MRYYHSKTNQPVEVLELEVGFQVSFLDGVVKQISKSSLGSDYRKSPVARSVQRESRVLEDDDATRAIIDRMTEVQTAPGISFLELVHRIEKYASCPPENIYYVPEVVCGSRVPYFEATNTTLSKLLRSSGILATPIFEPVEDFVAIVAEQFPYAFGETNLAADTIVTMRKGYLRKEKELMLKAQKYIFTLKSCDDAVSFRSNELWLQDCLARAVEAKMIYLYLSEDLGDHSYVATTDKYRKIEQFKTWSPETSDIPFREISKGVLELEKKFYQDAEFAERVAAQGLRLRLQQKRAEEEED